jgi:flavin reductase (DIM6/NTAB) family NADH-FMN oxidoreductase RutF
MSFSPFSSPSDGREEKSEGVIRRNQMKPIGPVNALYPMPTTLVGATVSGKPNFLAVAHVGILNHGKHQYLSIGLAKIHYTNAGIHENRSFSICLPSENLMVETDYCGIMTGKKTDKAALFDIFYGELKTAPMIRQCHVNMELKLHEVLDYTTHDIFVGELIQTYTDETVMTDGKIDIAKLRPLLFDMASVKYWSLGPVVGNCWNAGKSLKKK